MGPTCLDRGGSPESDHNKQKVAPDGAGVGHAALASLTRRVSNSRALEGHRTGGIACRDSMKKHGDQEAAVLFVIGNLLGAMPQVFS